MRAFQALFQKSVINFQRPEMVALIKAAGFLTGPAEKPFNKSIEKTVGYKLSLEPPKIKRPPAKK
jgi:hypothetical protein